MDPTPPDQHVWTLLSYTTLWISDAFNVASVRIFSSLPASPLIMFFPVGTCLRLCSDRAGVATGPPGRSTRAHAHRVGRHFQRYG